MVQAYFVSRQPVPDTETVHHQLLQILQQCQCQTLVYHQACQLDFQDTVGWILRLTLFF